MVFNILIDNTDDHEKNHALLVTDSQPWRMSWMAGGRTSLNAA